MSDRAPPTGLGDTLARKAALVEFAEDPIIGLTLDGVITDWNPAAERLSGYSGAEAIGASIMMLVPPERRGQPGFLRRVRAGEVIRRCSRSAWPRTLDGMAFSVSVNLAPPQVAHPGLADRVGEILDASGLDPGRLHPEITESALIEESELTIRNLLDLDAIGVRLVRDDFGTGYSALAYLRRFPIAAIKIDRRSIAGLGRDPDDTTIVEAIPRMTAGEP